MKKILFLILAALFVNGLVFSGGVKEVLFGDEAGSNSKTQAPTAKATSTSSSSSAKKTPAAGGLFNLVQVDGGSFVMGSEKETALEKPSHKVTVTGFYMSETEITQGVFRKVMGKNPSRNAGDSLPVENVTWKDAMEFCNKLSEMEGLEKCYWYKVDEKGFIDEGVDPTKNGYRLPTEAEWEYAARGGSKSNGYRYSGANDASSVAQYDAGKTMPVAQKKPNELGLYDMSGNVEEWCADKYDDYSSREVSDPFVSQGRYRIVRGGSYMSDASKLTVSARGYDSYANTFYRGFRVVRNMSQQIKSVPRSLTALAPRKIETHKFNMVLVEGGTFQMGSNERESEKPIHSVTVDSFYITETELTQELYKAITALSPRGFVSRSDDNTLPKEGNNYPIVNITWYEAIQLCNRLSELEGLEKCYSGELGGKITLDLTKNGYRLPTEAEWEFAARGGNKSKGYKYSGSNDIDEVSWYKKGEARDERYWEEIHFVAQKKPNELGLYDMSGNVDELCSDWYGDYSGKSQTNPTGPAEGNAFSELITRGGAGNRSPECNTVAFRSYDEYGFEIRKDSGYRNVTRIMDYRYDSYTGLRLVRSAKNVSLAKSASPKANTAVSTAWSKGLTVNVFNDGVPERINFLGKDHLDMKHTAPFTKSDGSRPIAQWKFRTGMRLVRGGTFQMGSSDKSLNAGPVHEVTVGSFYITETEITQKQYEAVMGKNPSWNKAAEGEAVVEMVTWFDAVEFCNKLSEKEGLEKCYSGSGNSIVCDFNKNGYRLPTEAEWEYAARGGIYSDYLLIRSAAKSEFNTQGEWFENVNSPFRCENRLGIYNMTIGVGDWCWDRYAPYGKESSVNPIGPESGNERVARGNDAMNAAFGTSGEKQFPIAYNRSGRKPDATSDRYGFRVVRNAE